MTRQEKIQAIRQRRQAIKIAGRSLPRRTRPPRQIYPHALENQYFGAISRLLAPFFDGAAKALKDALPAIVAARDAALKADSADMRADAGYANLLGLAIDGIRINVAKQVTEQEIADTAGDMGRRVSKFNAGQVDRQFTAVLGIPVLRQERWMADKLEAFVTGNVALIKDIPEKSIADLSSSLMARIEAGDSNRTLARLVDDRLSVGKSRAEFIARDQVAKLNGKLTELRHKEVGVSEYIWRAVKDGATRASHLRNDGKTFKWSDPPATGHPGEDYQCRCTADPVLDDFIAPMQEKKAA